MNDQALTQYLVAQDLQNTGQRPLAQLPNVAARTKEVPKSLSDDLMHHGLVKMPETAGIAASQIPKAQAIWIAEPKGERSSFPGGLSKSDIKRIRFDEFIKKRSSGPGQIRSKIGSEIRAPERSQPQRAREEASPAKPAPQIFSEKLERLTDGSTIPAPSSQTGGNLRVVRPTDMSRLAPRNGIDVTAPKNLSTQQVSDCSKQEAQPPTEEDHDHRASESCFPPYHYKESLLRQYDAEGLERPGASMCCPLCRDRSQGLYVPLSGHQIRVIVFTPCGTSWTRHLEVIDLARDAIDRPS